MLTVCHLTSVHSSNDVRIFHKECVSLAKAGYEVFLVALNTENRTEKGVNIIGISHKSQSRISRITSGVNRVLKKALEVNADIYHLHDPELLRIAKKLKKAGKKVIYDAHEDVPRQVLSKYWIPKFFRLMVAALFERYENRIVKKLDLIITATPYIRNRFVKINANTIDINNYPLQKEIPDDENWENKENAVCYTGGISDIRGLEEIVRAMEELKDVKLLLAGPYSPENYRNHLKSLDGWKHVQEYGMVSRDEVSNILRQAIAGIVTFLPLPNHIDAQPNKMFEYMAAGLPVICSDFPLWKDIVEKYECGICVDPLNPKKIVKAINYLLNNKEEAIRMGYNGRKMILQKYNWNNEEKRLISCYENLS